MPNSSIALAAAGILGIALAAACSAQSPPAVTPQEVGGDAPSAGAAAGGDAGATGAPAVPNDAGGASPDAGAAAMAPSRGPTPAEPGVAFPFPQNRESANCSYPSRYDNADVTAAYQQWKTDTVTSAGANGFLRVQRPHEPGLQPNSTVSEGIGYGMLLAAYMNDQDLFDQLWEYEQHWTDGSGLMNWYIAADGTGLGPNGQGAATDADEDMAFALVLADKQWGGQGMLSQPYAALALQQIKDIWKSEIQDGKLPKPGEWGGWSTVNISYFAPAYYRVFATLDPGDDWAAVVQTVYDTLAYAVTAANGNASNGLVPAWCDDSHGSPCTPIDEGIANDTGYQYDACRTPFRIGVDWCWNAEPRAKAYVALTSSFFGAGGAQAIADGYAIDGTPMPQHPGGHSAAFVGPAGVGAMSSPAYASLLDGAYAGVATRTYLVGGTYYEDSWTAMSLLMMTGNFLDYTKY
ncbi:MAG TPA: glycosyl hydrolase family 8 [Polyangiaceae bacterium]|jgi:endo-1,4-beta-D-glucanase Y|nr:glycosyl hydrolase family 8 [Polyangiaceae bacterium]